jgi:CBS domain-containing protein
MSKLADKESVMITAGELIRKKGSDIWMIQRDETVYAAMKMMAEKDAGALLVMGDDKIAGIISERDCVRKIDVLGRSSRETRVVAIMTEKVMYVEATQPLEEVMALMIDKNIRHMPVMDGSKLLGIISIRDVLKEVIAQQKFLISQLEHYIRG